ncbi:hypothetical protein DES40_0202 [Litorimonas taeanensis]|uniref:Uncharacterized protein n=1 Tax=Litorimonas taeanensis TaxID=568099 RepID=A0A420WIY4_9PROT|nr:hypothetical protein [Litorimonas taeanensis]RKQ70899.1 hypothetical protein DES40_0202 [Litorimonas taeanensis]
MKMNTTAKLYNIHSVEILLHNLIDAMEGHETAPFTNENISSITSEIASVEKFIRCGMNLLKFIEALTTQNEKHMAANAEKAEIRYEDLPPLNAEDLLALRRRFTHLANATSIGAGLGEFYPEPEFK